MSETASYMLPLGSVAPKFRLPNTIDGNFLSLDEIRGPNGTLVVFICNHCPYVLHLLDKIVEVFNDVNKNKINSVAISSNDIENYPQDHPDQMKMLALDYNFRFPYLYDEDQSVALAYEAACTPDFFLFNSNLKLVYRGRFDDARPKNNEPVTGKYLIQAINNLSNGLPQSEIQVPSLGCNIKWKKGNEPKGFFN